MKLSELVKTCANTITTVSLEKDGMKLLSLYDLESMSNYVGDPDILKWYLMDPGTELHVELREKEIKREEYEFCVNADGMIIKTKTITNKDFLEALPTQDPHKYDDYDIRNLRIGKAALNKLSSLGVTRIGELRELTVEDLMSVPRLGKGRIKDIRRALYEFNCHLKDDEGFRPA